jgi:two-component system LytT family sensor kinase
VTKIHTHIALGAAILVGSLLLSTLISLIIGFTYEQFIWVASEVVIIDSVILGFTMVMCLYLADHMSERTSNNALILILSGSIVLGAGILTFLGFFISSPSAFLYSGNRTITFLLINMLFFVSINIIFTGGVIFRKTIVKNEKALNEEKVLKTQMELKLLSSKINPHFLFNSLNLLVSLLKQPEKAETALINLSEILRFQLDFYKSALIDIHEELRIVEKYLAIQKMRFGSKLDYRIDCSTAGNIPPLIIQPIVENSIKHNIDETDHLTIRVVVENIDGITIRIEDSEAKLEPDMIDKGDGLTITKKRVEHARGIFLIKNGGVEISFGHD